MSSKMQYMVRTGDGTEYGPVDQDGLVQWAQSGRITADCQIRNALMKQWNPAGKTPFLKEIISKQSSSQEGGGSLKGKLSNLVGQKPGNESGGLFKYAAAPLGMRFAAWLIDTAIVLAVGAIIITTAKGMLAGGADEKVVFIGFTLVSLLWVFGYYTFLLAFKAQSIGQTFWGLMVVRPDGEPVLMGRALIFSVCYILFSWTTLIFVFSLPSKKALQDIMSGLVVARTSSIG